MARVASFEQKTAMVHLSRADGECSAVYDQFTQVVASYHSHIVLCVAHLRGHHVAERGSELRVPIPRMFAHHEAQSPRRCLIIAKSVLRQLGAGVGAGVGAGAW